MQTQLTLKKEFGIDQNIGLYLQPNKGATTKNTKIIQIMVVEE